MYPPIDSSSNFSETEKSKMDSVINPELNSGNTETYQKCVGVEEKHVPSSVSKGSKKRYRQRRVLKKETKKNNYTSKKQDRVCKKVKNAKTIIIVTYFISSHLRG